MYTKKIKEYMLTMQMQNVRYHHKNKKMFVKHLTNILFCTKVYSYTKLV